MKSNIILGKSCVACNKERKGRVLRYDPKTLYAYCDNPYICDSEDHPNSELNIVKRGKSLTLISHEEAVEAYKQELLTVHNVDQVKRIQAILTKPVTIRVQDAEMAEFIVKYQNDYLYKSVADVFRVAVLHLMGKPIPTEAVNNDFKMPEDVENESIHGSEPDPAHVADLGQVWEL